jgi:hypothetical protein
VSRHVTGRSDAATVARRIADAVIDRHLKTRKAAAR